MMSSGGKTVALIDPLWIGHHPMYFSQFTAAFLRLGAKVIGLCPDPEAAKRELLANLNGEDPISIQNRVYFHKLPPGSRSFFKGRFEGDPVRTFRRWKRAADTLADAEAVCGVTCDLIYFPYLDSYLRFLPFPIIPGLLMGRPWSGLYLRNHHHGQPPSLVKSLRLLAKGDALIRSKLCREIGVLDERFVLALRDYTTKSVLPYPDVTQGGLPNEPFPLSLEIKRKARGRTIIGMIGLEKRKGLVTLLKAAELARRQDLPLYFVCAGIIHLAQYTDREQQWIQSLAEGVARGEINNLHFDPDSERIPSEADYNSLFLTFNIAWAAYENFQGSSGTLSKAALFEIPCIATAGECVGQRVEKYHMGLTIPAASSEHALDAIKHIAAGNDLDGRPLVPRFADYRDDHSLAKLDHILSRLLDET